MLMYILLGISYLCPLFIFFDYNKPSNVRYAILYLVVFAAFWIVVLPNIRLSPEQWLIVAGSMPILLIIFLFIAKKRKGSIIKRKTNHKIIDDMD